MARIVLHFYWPPASTDWKVFAMIKNFQNLVDHFPQTSHNLIIFFSEVGLGAGRHHEEEIVAGNFLGFPMT